MTDRPATLVAKLARGHGLSPDEYAALIDARTPALADELAGRAREVCEAAYGDARVRARAHRVHERLRHRLLLLRHPAQQPRLRALPPGSASKFWPVPMQGRQAGFRTFVLQGGEDPAVTDEWLAELVGAI